MDPSTHKSAVANTDRRWWLRSLVRAVIVLAAGYLFLAGIGLGQRTGWLRSGAGPGSAATPADAAAAFTCPMHPQIRQPMPGRCPICGMALVQATSTASTGDEFSIEIDPAMRRVAGIETAVVERASFHDVIETVGRIEYDESQLATISAYVDGRIERMFADYTGVSVAKGDHLVSLYSPELYTAQTEFLQTEETLAKMGSGALPVVVDAQKRLAVDARKKLIELGMTEVQVQDLEKSQTPISRLTIYSPIGGTVIEKLAFEGQYVKTGDVIYRIADLSMVWLMLELFPEDASRVRFGQVVEAEVQSLPGQVFVGRVAFIDPVVDRKNRTVSVRVEIMNLESDLRPGDYATARIEVPMNPQGAVFDAALAGKWISPMHPQIIRDQPGECPICGMALVPTSKYGYSEKPLATPEALLVPRNAVLMAGKSSVVYVETEPGRFEIRSIVMGPVTPEKVVVLDGLQEGEAVATSGNFLIDSQMQLASKPSVIDPMAAADRRASPASIHIEALMGDAGMSLEALYHAYFQIQETLASDQPIDEGQRDALVGSANSLAATVGLDSRSRNAVASIAKSAEHLHHLELEGARKTFLTISESTIDLARHVRGENADRGFLEYHCPMVEGGKGDWLQLSEPPANPYFGSKMLRCAELVASIPTAEEHAAMPHDPSAHAPEPEHTHDHGQEE